MDQPSRKPEQLSVDYFFCIQEYLQAPLGTIWKMHGFQQKIITESLDSSIAFKSDGEIPSSLQARYL